MVRLIDTLRVKEVWDWIFFKDSRPAILRNEALGVYSFAYDQKQKGPVQNSLLQPFSILHCVEWDEEDYALGSCIGFKAGDARFFFPGENVEIVKRRFAIEYVDDDPVYWEAQLFSNNGVVLSRQSHTATLEPIRVTEVFLVDEPENLLARSYFEERKDCFFCTSRDVECDCPNSLRVRSLQAVADVFNGDIQSINKSAWKRMRSFHSIGGEAKNAQWLFSMQFPVEGKLVTVSNFRWSVKYKYLLSGPEVESERSAFIQDRILANTPPKSSTRWSSMESSVSSEDSMIFLPLTMPKRTSKDSGQKKSGAGKPPSECPECGAKFVRIYEMKRHIMSVHLKVRNFVCKQCDKAFTQKAHLTNHIYAVHDDIRNIPCSLCDLKFRRNVMHRGISTPFISSTDLAYVKNVAVASSRAVTSSVTCKRSIHISSRRRTAPDRRIDVFGMNLHFFLIPFAPSAVHRTLSALVGGE
eukprot:CAMPEP_0184752040 /NCGR_PEP_ID=MMETSP0315-20130426/43372_1 /TAXON_ID=101924 /ORGANISM="Rhodosorus marinus, Strain UTEX LB 2760" /LENGTH=468 /DNA_ID=CAMNT_0027231353 /DNA_START=1323 /DNA_END=2730 /DNA_ORIENTATION=+